MKKIRLLVDGHVFSGKYQGTRTYLKGLYNQELDDRFEIFIGCEDEAIIEKEFPSNNKICFIKYKSKSKYFRLSFELPRIIEQYKIDALHVQYVSPLKKNCFQIVTIHDLLFMDFKNLFPLSYRLKNHFLFKRSAKQADLLLTVSEYSKMAIQRHFNLNKEVFITPNGVDPFYLSLRDSSFTQGLLNKYNLKKYVLYISRLEPRKNQHTLINIFKKLSLFDDYQLVLVGAKDINYTNLRDSLNDTNLIASKQLFLFQNLPQDIMGVILKNAHLFVYPSLAEGFGIPPLEAALAGVSVLCSDQTAMKDFPFNKDDFFNPNNLNDFEDKLLKKLNQKSSDIDYKESILLNYNWANISNTFFNLLASKFQSKSHL